MQKKYGFQEPSRQDNRNIYQLVSEIQLGTDKDKTEIKMTFRATYHKHVC
jgi:hypothetical protein